VPNEFIVSQVKKFFAKTLKSAVQSVYNQQFSYELHIFTPFQAKVVNPLHVDIRKLLKISASVVATPSSVESKNTVTETTRGYGLQSQLTFDTIVSGAHIDFALSAARAVADAPGKVYNPLFVYGHVGLGKTHLLNAIGNYISKYHSGQKILFLPTTQLIDHIVLAIRKNKLPALLSEFKKIDVLLLDDIQFL
jgi:chromosomal replication initiator protein